MVSINLDSVITTQEAFIINKAQMDERNETYTFMKVYSANDSQNVTLYIGCCRNEIRKMNSRYLICKYLFPCESSNCLPSLVHRIAL